MPRYIRNTDAFGWQGADGPNGPWRPIAPPQSGTPWQTNASDGRLTSEQIDAFLAKYTDPADARQFLVEAGLIDKNGELAGPYRPSPIDDLRQASADVSGVEVLSPDAQAVWDAAWQLSPVNCKSHEDRRRQQIAAALRAAADQVIEEVSPVEAILTIAAELEGDNG
jgi:hypothetical protein